MPHLFEFMDLEWLPKSLRDTLRDILECGNSRPFRGYYDWVTDEVLRVAKNTGCTRIVELGAGTAPVTRLLMKKMAADPTLSGLTLIPCDLSPDEANYKRLKAQGGGHVQPSFEPVDFEKPRDWEPQTLTVLSATLHHLPEPRRSHALATLTKSSAQLLVFEPLRNTIPSMLYCLLSVFPALLTPVVYLCRPSAIRRFVWCWAIPVAPVMFVWDGVVSCMRQSDPLRTHRAACAVKPTAVSLFCHAWVKNLA